MRTSSPSCVVTNDCAIRQKLAPTRGGTPSFAVASTCFTAVPIDIPCARLNDTVTDGSWPEWFTVTGPTVYLNFATVLSGTSGPRDERTHSFPSASTSCWYSGSNSITTQYS